MSINTPEHTEDPVQAFYDDTVGNLRRLGRKLETFVEKVEAGEDPLAVAGDAQIRRLRSLLEHVEKAERLLHERQHERSRRVPPGCEIDLDAARREISCALYRIAACGEADGISG